MSDNSKKAVKSESNPGAVILEMMVDESKKDKYKLILPLSYGVEFSEADGKGKNTSFSPVKLTGTKAVIRTPGSPARWKIRVTGQADFSNEDPTGQPVSVDGDGSGDGFKDWLETKKEGLDENSRQMVQKVYQSARRTIILQQEGE